MPRVAPLVSSLLVWTACGEGAAGGANDVAGTVSGTPKDGRIELQSGPSTPVLQKGWSDSHPAVALGLRISDPARCSGSPRGRALHPAGR